MPGAGRKSLLSRSGAAARGAVRRRVRARRRSLSAAQRRRCAHRAARLIARTGVFRGSRRIAFYFPNDGELDLTPLIARARAMKKTCYLPVLDVLTSDRLWFAPYEEDGRLVANRYGIPEPLTARRRLRRARQLDLILTPLVAFDVRGNRLGMGGGYYDRTLRHLGRPRHWRRPRVYGAAYELQKVADLARRPWDIALDGIFTEQTLYIPGRR